VEVVIEDAQLLAVDAGQESFGHGSAFDEKVRQRLDFLRDAVDERDLYALKSLHFEKLKGSRSHERSIKINNQWRMILRIEEKGSTKRIVVSGVEDYH
jgi:proteic killer suppression protein